MQSILKNKGVERHRAEEANKRINITGDPEPPTLYSAAVYRQAKYEAARDEYLDPDPLKALEILASSQYVSEIVNLSIKPFYIQYWTNTQLQIFKKYSNVDNSFITIDASGKFVHRLKKMFNVPCGPIFLYQVELKCDAGQISIAQMLSESHDTNNIQYFLLNFKQKAARSPREIVMDMSKALLNGVTRAFTSFNYIEEYAEACHGTDVPDVFIRLDVAHFMKLYATFFKKHAKQTKIKRFYLAVIGQIVMCRNISDAEILLRSVFILCFSESDGLLSDGSDSLCEKAKKYLRCVITGD